MDKTNRQAAVNLGFLLLSQGRLEEGYPLLQMHEQTLTEEEDKAILQLIEQWQMGQTGQMADGRRNATCTAPPTNPSAQATRLNHPPAAASRTQESPRKIFIDLGANLGNITAKFAEQHPDFELIAVEPNRDLINGLLEKSLEISRPVSVIWAAASTHDGRIQLFKSTRHEASTIVMGKIEYEQFGWTQIDYSNGHLVPCIDFSAWLAKIARNGDEVIVKMDIEGAEYDVLEKLIADGNLKLIKTLFCEWHADRFPAIQKARHDNLVRSLSQMVDLQVWV